MPKSGLTPSGEGAPKISVLVPTYNYARYLPQAIESILRQTHSNFELLISDDASTDGSAEIIRHYADRDFRIRFELHATNLGMVANWNWCLQQARGDYVKFVFGDDLLASPDTLVRMAALLDQYPDVGLVASARLLLDRNSTTIGSWDHLSDGLFDGPRLISRCLRTRRNLIGEPSTVIFRRSLAERGFDPAYRQIVDLEMWFHLLKQGRLCYTSETLCGFRRHDEQQTVANGRGRVTDLELIDLLQGYRQLPALRNHLRPDRWAYRWILYRQLHYARKATNRDAAAVAVARMESQIPSWQRAFYWVWHRITRPMENLLRKARQGIGIVKRRISPEKAEQSASSENFIRTLPALLNGRRDDNRLPSDPRSPEGNGPSWIQAFQQRLPRQITIGMMAIGAASIAGIMWDLPSERRTFPPHLSGGGPPFSGRRFSRMHHQAGSFAPLVGFDEEQPANGHPVRRDNKPTPSRDKP
jgi:glycosyltransferase involved in cell wall biosynthesis